MSGWGTSLSGFGSTIQMFDDIRMQFDDDAVFVVGPTAKYGVYQELGTSKMKPQPYLFPAAREVQRSVPRILSQTGITSTEEAVKTVALEIEALAKRFAPVGKTGHLRRSIEAKKIR